MGELYLVGEPSQEIIAKNSLTWAIFKSNFDCPLFHLYSTWNVYSSTTEPEIIHKKSEYTGCPKKKYSGLIYDNF